MAKKLSSYLFLEDIETGGVLEVVTKEFNGENHLITRHFTFTTKYQKNNFKVEKHRFKNMKKTHEDFIKKLIGK